MLWFQDNEGDALAWVSKTRAVEQKRRADEIARREKLVRQMLGGVSVNRARLDLYKLFLLFLKKKRKERKKKCVEVLLFVLSPFVAFSSFDCLPARRMRRTRTRMRKKTRVMCQRKPSTVKKTSMA